MSELFDAIRRGDAEAVRALVESDRRLASSRENNVTALLTALYHGQTEIAHVLAEMGASISFAEACAAGDMKRVRKLLDADPSLLDRKSDDGFPPLGLAIFFRHPDVAKLLIERDADVNAVSENAQRVAPIHAAAAVRDHASLKLLLEHGADPNAKQQDDFTPLHAAASRGDIEMAKMLMSFGARRDPSVVEIAAKYSQPAFAEWFQSSAVGE